MRVIYIDYSLRLVLFLNSIGENTKNRFADSKYVHDFALSTFVHRKFSCWGDKIYKETGARFVL